MLRARELWQLHKIKVLGLHKIPWRQATKENQEILTLKRVYFCFFWYMYPNKKMWVVNDAFAKAMVQVRRKPLIFSFTLLLVTLVYKKCIRRLIVAEALLWMLNETSAIDMHVLFFLSKNWTQHTLKSSIHELLPSCKLDA